VTSEKKQMTVRAVWLTLIRHPGRTLIWQWNWQSALLSSLLRASIFFLANLIAGWHAALGAAMAELTLRLITSGFYGAVTEGFSAAQPAWAATATVMVGLPMSNHSIESLVHGLRGTPELALSITTSVCFTAISSAFNLYAMRHGVLTVGRGSKSLPQDLYELPSLLFSFMLSGPRAILRWVSRTAYPGSGFDGR
jgi:hypothetical protein